MFRFFLIWLFLIAPATALAQTSTVSVPIDPNLITVGELPALIQLMVKTFQGGGYAIASGLLLALLVACARFFKLLDWIPDAYDKWVAMTIAVLTSVAVGLMSGQDLLTMILAAVNVGAIAIGGWEVILKQLRDRILQRSRV